MDCLQGREIHDSREGQSSIKVYLEYDDIGLVQAAMHLNIALNSGLARLKRRAAMLPRSKRDEKPHMVHSDWFAESHTAAIYYDGKILTCKCKSPPDALEQAQKLKELVQFSSQKINKSLVSTFMRASISTFSMGPIQTQLNKCSV
ncbi:hypothetical protein H4Q26_009475 [Puccinia striiformis f. sp. tritici PST-130]|nr:hypothetical protein H4Q26_009475 [Puccinia striiformis f. sp. tritici PST-130]